MVKNGTPLLKSGTTSPTNRVVASASPVGIIWKQRRGMARGSAAGKTGGTDSVCNVFDKNKKSERTPDGE